MGGGTDSHTETGGAHARETPAEDKDVHSIAAAVAGNNTRRKAAAAEAVGHSTVAGAVGRRMRNRHRPPRPGLRRQKPR